MKGVFFMVFGVVVGVAATVAVGWNVMPGMMIDVQASALPFEATVTAIEVAAKENGWKVPKIYDIRQSLRKAGHDIPPVKVLSLCQPDHANEILSDDESRYVSGMMPCRIGVFQTDDGTVYISKMDIGLMSRMFGGRIERVMGQAAVEEKEILKGIVAK
jgi:uncharacterized protein (DUF302 family)